MRLFRSNLAVNREDNEGHKPEMKLLSDEKPFGQRIERRPVETSGNNKNEELLRYREQIGNLIRRAESIAELRNILKSGENGPLRIYGAVIGEIADLENYYRINAESIIINDIITPKLEEKDPKARLFAQKWQTISDPLNLGIKEKVKALLRKEMVKDFETNNNSYAREAVSQIRTFEQLEHVVGQFKKIYLADSAKDRNKFYTGQEMNNLIKDAKKYINNFIEYRALLKSDDDTISYEINSALSIIPVDNIGIYGKTRQLMTQAVDRQKQSLSAPKENEGSLFKRLGKRVGGFFSKK